MKAVRMSSPAFRALIQSDRFDLAWQAMTEAANENQALDAIAA